MKTLFLALFVGALALVTLIDAAGAGVACGPRGAALWRPALWAALCAALSR